MWLWFILAGLALSFVGRKIGWVVSRAFLYTAPMHFVVGCCILWGLLVCFAIQGLIQWLQPGTVIRWIFGYLLGWYVAIPNFGLVLESTIPPKVRDRHLLVSVLPALVYIAVSLAFGFSVFSFRKG